MLNRGALIVRPKQPFVDWALGLDDSGMAPPFEGEKTVYLVPDFEDPRQQEKVLEMVYEEVFENELWGWYTDEGGWPRDRTLAMFKEWFHIEMHSVVRDLCGYLMVDDDL